MGHFSDEQLSYTADDARLDRLDGIAPRRATYAQPAPATLAQLDMLAEQRSCLVREAYAAMLSCEPIARTAGRHVIDIQPIEQRAGWYRLTLEPLPGEQPRGEIAHGEHAIGVSGAWVHRWTEQRAARRNDEGSAAS